jgi:hypothetical protein
MTSMQQQYSYTTDKVPKKAQHGTLGYNAISLVQHSATFFQITKG